MTMLQVMLIEKFRGINTPEMQAAVDIIDTQARELIEARATRHVDHSRRVPSRS